VRTYVSLLSTGIQLRNLAVMRSGDRSRWVSSQDRRYSLVAVCMI